MYNMRIRQIAFTLIELLVVIAIIGILSGLIVVAMGGVTNSANVAKAQVFSNSLRNALMMNLVSEWRFDNITDYDSGTKIIGSTANNIPDSWGSNSGRAYGGPILKDKTECVSGKCVNFDGSTNYIDYGNPSGLNISQFPMTIDGWVYPTATTGTILCKRVSGWANTQYSLALVSDNVYLSFSDGTNSQIARTNTSFGTGKWHHIAGTMSSSTNMKIYIDGQSQSGLVFSGSATAMYSNAGTVKIGDGNGGFFAGKIDDVRVYNALIPIAEIKKEYYAGLNNLLANGSINKEEYSARANMLAEK